MKKLSTQTTLTWDWQNSQNSPFHMSNPSVNFTRRVLFACMPLLFVLISISNSMGQCSGSTGCGLGTETTAQAAVTGTIACGAYNIQMSCGSGSCYGVTVSPYTYYDLEYVSGGQSIGGLYYGTAATGGTCTGSTATVSGIDVGSVSTYYFGTSRSAAIGCGSWSGSSAILKYEYSSPTVSLTGGTGYNTTASVCVGATSGYTISTTKVDGSNAAAYSWTVTSGTATITSATTATPTVTFTTAGSVVIKCTVTNGTCTATASTSTITVVPASTAPTTATATPATICNGQATVLTYSGGSLGTGGVAHWYSGSCGGTAVGTGNSLSVSPTTTTNYYVRYEDPTPCSTLTACATVTVTVNQKSVAPTTATATPATICNGQATVLTYSGGSLGTSAIAHWYTGSCGGTSVGTGNSLSVSPTTTTTYYVRYEDAAPCSVNTTCATVTVTVNQLSTAPTGASASSPTICVGSSTTLTYSGGSLGTGAVAHWYSGSCGGTSVGTGNSLSVSPGSTTNYYIRYEDPAPCSVNTACYGPLTVTVNTGSTAPTGIFGTTTICNGGSTTLTEVGGALGTGATYQWGTGGTVGVSPIGGATASSYAASPTSATTYWVSVTGIAPCGSPGGGATQLITVNNVSTAPTGASATPATICNGGSSTLAVTGGSIGTGGAAHWYTGSCGGTAVATGTSISVSPTTTTTYYVRYEDGAPCSDNTTCQTVTVTVNQKSTAPTGASASSPTICTGSSTTLTYSGGSLGTSSVAHWYSGSCGGTSVGTGNSLSVSPTTTTTYYIRFEDPAPCSVNTTCQSVTVTVSQQPTATTGATHSATACTSAGTYAVPSGYGSTNGTILWTASSTSGTTGTVSSPATLTPTYNFSAADIASGATVTLTMTVSNSPCTAATATFTLTINVTPTPTFTTTPTNPICNYTNATYTTQAAQSSYVWSGLGTLGTDYNIISGGVGSTDNTVTIQWISTGTKTVTVGYTTGGCASTSPASFTTVVNARPVPSLSTSGAGCAGSTITYTTQSGQSSYVWTIPGTPGTDYTLISGGTGTDYTAVISWITTGSKTVTVNYSIASSCTGVTAGSSTITINAAPTSVAISDNIDPCNGGHTAYVVVTGGTSPYTFLLTPPGTYHTLPSPAEIDAAGASSISISNVTDANGCAPGSTSGNPVTYPSRVLTSGYTQSCNIPANSTQIFFDGSGNLMSKITSGATALGSTSVTASIDGSVQKFGPTDQQSYLQRHFKITPTTTTAPANVCLYISDAEVSALNTSSATDLHTAPAFYQTFSTSLTNANITQYDGGSETPGSHTSRTVITSLTATHNPTVDGATYSSAWQVCFNVSGFSGFYIHANNVNNDPLPVTLVSFTATAINNKYVELNWITASEINNAGFQVERSIDGTNYEILGWLDGHGNSTQTNAYQTIDMTALPGVVYYYRLKQVDVDGRFAYSNIASAELLGPTGFTLENLFPNPASNQVSMGVISNVNTTAKVTMTDMLGRTVLVEDWQLSIGYNTNQFDLGRVTEGAYLVTIYAGNIKTTKKLTVAR